MTIHECEQLSPEWFELRRGIPTASSFSKIITAVKGDLSKSAVGYAHELIAERLGGFPGVSGWAGTDDMQNGRQYEGEARDWFAFHHDVEVRQVGLIVSDCGRFACSPDGLFCPHGITSGLEIKVPRLSTHIGWLSEGRLPDEHKQQVHGGMAISGLTKWRFISYPIGRPMGIDPLVVTVERDEYTDKVEAAMNSFWALLLETANKLGVKLEAANEVAQTE